MVLHDISTEPLLIQAVFKGDIDEVRTLVNIRKCDLNTQNPSTRITALHAAAHCGYTEIVELLCSVGARVNHKDMKCLSPLHYACRVKNEEVVKELLKYEADVNARDRNWQAPLHVCATYNAVGCAKLLVPLMQNIDVTDRLGRSALSHAAFCGNLQMVELLLENGANSNIHDKQERRPIHWATFVGYAEIIKVLKKHGADINCIDKEHYTPLLVACASGRSEEILRLLIEFGANLHASTIHDSSAFHLACLNGHDATIKELLLHNVEMRSNEKGYHPIHYAAVSKRGAFCLELLINLGIDVNWRAHDGKTPLHICALHHSLSCAQILIYHGAVVNSQDNEKNTPLHLAALHGNDLMISLLIQYNASINIRGANGLLSYAVAALNGHSECFKELDTVLVTAETRRNHFETRDDQGRTFLHLAALAGNVDCVDMFLSCGCNVNSVDKNGNTPLHYACSGPFMQCILTLLTNGAELDMVNSNGCTPLMYACAFDSDSRAVRTMITGRANAKLTDKFGYNALHYASLQGNKRVFELLLEKCKNLNHQENELLLSPLHILAYYGYKDALEILASNLTNLDVQDKNGRTPLDLACFKGSLGCVECLLLNGANCDLVDYVTQRTALHSAAYNNNDDCIKLILMLINDKKNLINSKDKHQRTPLMIAVEQGHFSTSLYLISQQADLDAVDDKNCTALHRAAALGYEECCELLLKSNASPIIRDVNGLLPLHYIVISGHAQLLPLFLEIKYDTLLDNRSNTLLHYACFNGHSTCAEILCENEYILNTVDYLIKNGRFTVLHCACYNGHETCVSFLLQTFQEKYTQNIADSKDHLGRTALHVCAINDEAECASILIQAGCSINEVSANGDTALMLAAAHNSMLMLELLFENNASVKVSNKDKNTALHLALLSAHEASTRFLLDKITDATFINQVNKDGQTALHLAAANGFPGCVENLLSKGANIWVKDNKSHTPLLSCAKSDPVAECLEIMLTKFLHTIQAYDNNNSLFTSSTVLLNNDVNMFNNTSVNNETFLQNQPLKLNHINIELNTTCTINQMGTTHSIDESAKDHSVQSSDSEFY